jgi:hypothetical protein
MTADNRESLGWEAAIVWVRGGPDDYLVPKKNKPGRGGPHQVLRSSDGPWCLSVSPGIACPRPPVLSQFPAAFFRGCWISPSFTLV